MQCEIVFLDKPRELGRQYDFAQQAINY